MTMQEIGASKNVNTDVTFNPEFPSCQNMDVFEIRLTKMGSMPEPVVMRAALDTTREFQTEGCQWTAMEAGADFSRGDRIPSHRVEGWRNID